MFAVAGYHTVVCDAFIINQLTDFVFYRSVMWHCTDSTFRFSWCMLEVYLSG